LAYSPKRGEHAGEVFASYYQYRNQVIAKEQGYRGYRDQQETRRQARDAGIPVREISDTLKAKGASNVEALALQARLELRTGTGSSQRRLDRFRFYVDEIEALHPAVDEDDLFPDSP
jgi:DNA-binding transcriptional MerR regulator